MTTLTGLHLRSSRALLRWRVQDLAKKSRVNIDTLKRAELLDGPVNMSPDDQQSIITVLELAGVSIIDDANLGVGAAYRKGPPRLKGMIG
jgi:hypothetical protein